MESSSFEVRKSQLGDEAGFLHEDILDIDIPRDLPHLITS